VNVLLSVENILPSSPVIW